tara:strand:+ start:259 stop:648 length:390 start_codon:yes stop_codon:yes gene_type:complete
MSNKDNGLLAIRIGVGLLFIIAGFGKLTGILGPGISGFSGMVFGSVILAWVVALAELLGGVAVLTGFKTKCASWGLAIIVLGALFKVHFPAFDASAPMTVIGVFMHLSLLATLIGLGLAGSGSHAVKAD